MSQFTLLQAEEGRKSYKPKLVESLAIPPDLDNAIVIQGFPGVGLVGSIAASFLLKEYTNKAKTIAGMLIEMEAPLLQMYSGNLIFPVSIFDLGLLDDSRHLLLATSTIPIQELQIYPILTLLLSFYRQKGISQIITLDAMISEMPENDDAKKKVFVFKSNAAPFHTDITQFSDGVLLGPTAATLFGTWIDKSISNLIIIGETYTFEPDPFCALSLLKFLNTHLSLSWNLDKLRELAEMLHEEKIKAIGRLTDSQKNSKSAFFYS